MDEEAEDTMGSGSDHSDDMEQLDPGEELVAYAGETDCSDCEDKQWRENMKAGKLSKSDAFVGICRNIYQR